MHLKLYHSFYTNNWICRNVEIYSLFLYIQEINLFSDWLQLIIELLEFILHYQNIIF